MKKIHLVCNAHIDPVWMWDLNEGVAETLSTYRVAADFCEDYDGFIFCHNEAMLYQWVEEYEPALFSRIQKLVAEKKWHIMGGWYLQPDCNLPSGESFVRQILAGKTYFMEKFGVEPNTSINFDAFGHSRGLVEILAKAGYDSYLFCRPEPDMLELPGDDFNWVGFSGSKIACHRAYNSYESHRGEADTKIKGWIDLNPDVEEGIVLWGIGNHGGGPSRVDYQKIAALNESMPDRELVHSTPEAYFASVDKENLPDYDGILNPRYTGCYTTQMRIKSIHRQLENELYSTEKMAAHAAMSGLMDYPKAAIDAATKDLLLVEFHDILPGSAIASVEKYSLELAGHGLEELYRVKTRAFLALCAGQPKAEDGTIPVLVYNPHPYEVEAIVECEFNLPDQNKNRALFAHPVVYHNGEVVPCQAEHEVSNFNVDWRKKSVFAAKLAPGQITRYDVKIELIPTPADDKMQPVNGVFAFDNGTMQVHINAETGCLDKYCVDGVDYITAGAFQPLAIVDDENSWAHKEKAFRQVKGAFKPMDPVRGAAFSGIIDGSTPASVRVIEDGDVRTVVEAVMEYADSRAVLRYFVPKSGSELKVTMKLYWNEKMTMLKLSVPTVLKEGFIGQTAYGSEQLLTNGNEMVSHKWNVLTGESGALSVINNCTYGSDCLDGELRITCLRSPGYSAGKSDFSVRKPFIMEQDRFSPFIDQGEHDYEFYLNASACVQERLNKVEREASAKNEKPTALSFFPTGEGEKVKAFATLSDDAVSLAVFKRSEKGDRYVLRLFNPTAQDRTTTLEVPSIGFAKEFGLKPYEFVSFAFDPDTKALEAVDLLERSL